MFSKKFSLETAYSQGARTVLNHFAFFLVAMSLGGFVIALALAFLGFVDFYTLRHHVASLVQMFHQVANSATGALHYGGTTIHESVSSMVSPSIAQQFVGQNVGSVDVKNMEIRHLVTVLVPTMLVLKMVIDMISIGWTKIALNLNANQSISLRFLFSYYYLVPRVFVINLIVGLLTIAGTMLFIVPGIFIYQRLRFAKFFVIDKNLSIAKSLQASWALTEQAVVQLFGFTVVSVLVEALGGLLIVLWLFISPLQNQVEANVYRQMLDK